MHGNASHSNAASGTESEQIAYKVPRAAELLDLGPRTVWQLVKDEEDEPGTGIESIKVGWSRRVPRTALLAFMERKRAQGRAVSE